MKLKKIILVGLLWSLQLLSVAQVPVKVGGNILRQGPRVAEIATGKVLNGVGMVGGNAMRKVPTLEVPVASMRTAPKLPSLENTNPSLKGSRLLPPTDLNIFRQLAAQIPHLGPVLPSVFHIRAFNTFFDFSFSGSVFRYQGRVYAVFAGHVADGLFAIDTVNTLKRLFEVDVMTSTGEKEKKTLSGRVVALAPGFDLALFQFDNPEDASLFNPLELDIQLPQVGEILRSEGFYKEQLIALDRAVRYVSPYSIRTNMPQNREERFGLCGGPVKALRMQNGRNEWTMVGVHIGSVRKAPNAEDDTGYIAPAWQLALLVDSYENGGGSFMFTSDNLPLLEMQVNEYISKITLYGEDNQVLETKKILADLPSQRLLRELLQTPSLKRMEFVLGRWEFLSPQSSFFKKKDNVRTVYYDLPEPVNK